MSENIFNSVRLQKPNRNVFDLSHDVKLSFNPGELIPVMCLECVPGDKFNISCETLLRFSPLVSPMMHRSDLFVHYFFVPSRLLWENWEEFITLTEIAGNVPAHPFWRVDTDNSAATYTRLLDYFGVPLQNNTLTPDMEVEDINAFPFAAYQFIYNEYYRDQNLIAPVEYELSDGNNGFGGTGNYDLIEMRIRAWEHDYFTAALPFAQKGDPVTIPISGFNDVPVKFYDISQPAGTNFTWNASGPAGNRTVNVDAEVPSAGSSGVQLNDIFADTSSLNSQAANINDLRRAFRLQEWLEKNARAGTRYTENILAHFGVRSSDARLQRPEYITGIKTPVVISEVLSTADTTAAPQGNMAGHAIAVAEGQYGNYYCEEHGYIIGIMSLRPKTAYQQGLERMWLKNDTFDYYFPEFANIGEQVVQNKEIFAYMTGGSGEFGYVPRYAEYRYMNNRVAGDFRTTLDFWHWGRIFDPLALPALNQTFIECVPDQRVFAVTDPDEDKLYCHILHKIRAVRSMPKYGTPSF